jgi:hypothetical protein
MCVKSVVENRINILEGKISHGKILKLRNDCHCEERQRRSNLAEQQRLLRGVYPELGEGLAMTLRLNCTALPTRGEET